MGNQGKFLLPRRASSACRTGSLLLVGLAAGLWAVPGCATKEAEDPRKILGDWVEHEGVDGTRGAEGSEPRTMRTAAPVAAASAAECQAAARRIEELALELAVKEAESPDEREALEARRAEELKSTGFRARVDKAAKDCVGRETSGTEARCVAKARSEMDLDRCAPR